MTSHQTPSAPERSDITSASAPEHCDHRICEGDADGMRCCSCGSLLVFEQLDVRTDPLAAVIAQYETDTDDADGSYRSATVEQRDAVAEALEPIVDRLLNRGDQRVVTAGRAIAALYERKHGGVWPDTRDEQRTVAEALGVPVPDEDDATLTVLWDVAQNGADEYELGAVHVAALLGFDEIEQLGLDGTGRFGGAS